MLLKNPTKISFLTRPLKCISGQKVSTKPVILHWKMFFETNHIIFCLTLIKYFCTVNILPRDKIAQKKLFPGCFMSTATHLVATSAPEPASDHLHHTDSRSLGSCTPTILQTGWRLLRLELQSENCGVGCFYCPHMQLSGISLAIYSLNKLQYHWDFFGPSFFLDRN